MIGKEMTPDVVYRVTKGNTEGSVFACDLVYLDKNTGDLAVDNCGWQEKADLSDDIMDFECEQAGDCHVVRGRWRTYIKREV